MTIEILSIQEEKNDGETGLFLLTVIEQCTSICKTVLVWYNLTSGVIEVDSSDDDVQCLVDDKQLADELRESVLAERDALRDEKAREAAAQKKKLDAEALSKRLSIN